MAKKVNAPKKTSDGQNKLFKVRQVDSKASKKEARKLAPSKKSAHIHLTKNNGSIDKGLKQGKKIKHDTDKTEDLTKNDTSSADVVEENRKDIGRLSELKDKIGKIGNENINVIMEKPDTNSDTNSSYNATGDQQKKKLKGSKESLNVKKKKSKGTTKNFTSGNEGTTELVFNNDNIKKHKRKKLEGDTAMPSTDETPPQSETHKKKKSKKKTKLTDGRQAVTNSATTSMPTTITTTATYQRPMKHKRVLGPLDDSDDEGNAAPPATGKTLHLSAQGNGVNADGGSSFWAEEAPGSGSTVNLTGVFCLPQSVLQDNAETESDDADEQESARKKLRKLSRRERLRAQEEREAALRVAERSRLSKDSHAPDTEHDYRELLQANPNSSATWIQLISHLLTSGEHERARCEARRGLGVISAYEHQERLQLWTVLVRLEVMYGTTETTETALADATANCDVCKLWTAVADIYADNNMEQKAEAIHYKLCKKFFAETEVWVRAGLFYFRLVRLDDARNTLARALRVLSKRDAVDVTNRFAQMEHKFGEAVKAKSMFESLVANYPKRLDVWLVYTDLLIKSNDITGARSVLSRMTMLRLRRTKMQSVFRKMLEFEKKHGNSRTQEEVRQRIGQYVTSQLLKGENENTQ